MDFETIYQTYFTDVYRYLRALSGSDHIAEEITADTFFKAMGAIDRFRGECDLRVWLCQIAKNCYASYCKKNSRFTAASDQSLTAQPAPAGSPEEQLIRRDEARQLRQLLHALPEPYKEVFLWRFFAQLHFKEIGALFGKSENWACVTYHRARIKLKTILEEQEHER